MSGQSQTERFTDSRNYCSMEFISPEQLRLDGRRPKELRQLQCEIGVLGQQADGSATFSMGNTKARLQHQHTQTRSSAAGRGLLHVPGTCRSWPQSLAPNRLAPGPLRSMAWPRCAVSMLWPLLAQVSLQQPSECARLQRLHLWACSLRLLFALQHRH